MKALMTSMLVVLAVALPTAQGQAEKAGAVTQGGGRMVRPNALIHVVANLEKSVEFYRDAVGFEYGTPTVRRLDALAALAASSGSKVAIRTASFAIPGSEMQLVLMEIAGASGRPFTQRLYDPGVTRFSIQVRDIERAFARVKDRGIVVDTTGGAPVYTQRPRNNTRAVMMRDPDGFVFEFVQGDPLPQTDVPASSNVVNARSSLAIENTDKALAFYRDLLGFTARPTNTVNEAVLALEGTPTAVARTTSTTPPGSTNVWFLWEFSQIERTKREPRISDPGASALSLVVENVSALMQRLKAAGVRVELDATTIGQVHAAVVRSPDGLLIELIEPR
jgi:catechol 2,3-dioxygenase-like lactoylglutathione lyase family enzyme